MTTKKKAAKRKHRIPVQPYQNLEGVRALAEMLANESERQGISLYEISELSEGKVRHQALYNISHGKVDSVDHRTLEGISAGLGISRDTVYDVYLCRIPVPGQPITETRPITLPVEIWQSLEAAAHRSQLRIENYLSAIIHHTQADLVPPIQATQKTPALKSVMNSQDTVKNGEEEQHLSTARRARGHGSGTRHSGS